MGAAGISVLIPFGEIRFCYNILLKEETERDREKKNRRALTKVCLEGLGFDYLTAVAAHDQVKVVLRRTLAEYGHICRRRRRKTQTDKHRVSRSKFKLIGFIAVCSDWYQTFLTKRAILILLTALPARYKNPLLMEFLGILPPAGCVHER